MNPDLLNGALALSLQWGPERMRPYTERLREQYPTLSEEEARDLERQCGEAESLAWSEIERAYLKKITLEEAQERIAKAYPWIDASNHSMLQTQGQYYAWKDNG
jgi:hypothetical protein